MTSTSREIAVDLSERLSRLEAILTIQGAPFVQCLRPGLTHEDTSAELRAAGVPPVPELLASFAWHDGAIVRSAPEMLYGWTFLPLEHASIMYRRMLESWESDVPAMPYWLKTWFPFAHNDTPSYIVVDIGGDPERVHPVFVSTDYEDLEDPDWPWPDAPSMSEFVSHFILTLESGSLYWDYETYKWEGNGVPPPSVPNVRYL